MSNGKTEKSSGIPPEKGTVIKTPVDQRSTKEVLPEKTPGDKKPDKYEGKSTDELRGILTEQEREMGKLSEKIDQFKGDVDYWRTKADATDRDRQLYGQTTPQTGAQPTQQAPAQGSRAIIDWTKPDESIDSLVEQKLVERDKVYVQDQVNRVVDEAKVAFNTGFEAARHSHPRLFEGKDFQRDVGDFMMNYYAPFAQKGIPVAHYVGNPKTWVRTAQNMRLERDEYDRIQPERIDPVSPTGTQRPDQAKPQAPEERPVDFSPGAKQMIGWMKDKGYVEGEEEATEMVQEARKERAEEED